jgi:hypothetical protein
LGLGWDPAWPRTRINRIKANCVSIMKADSLASA